MIVPRVDRTGREQGRVRAITRAWRMARALDAIAIDSYAGAAPSLALEPHRSWITAFGSGSGGVRCCLDGIDAVFALEFLTCMCHIWRAADILRGNARHRRLPYITHFESAMQIKPQSVRGFGEHLE
jgi:hypothetical protein